MFFARWLPTFVGFPIGGWIAVQIVGSIDRPGTAALAGLIAGAIIGAAQWLALRSVGGGARWMIATAAGMAVGSGVGAAITDAQTSVAALVLSGLITGAVVGASQGAVLARGRRVTVIWTAVVGGAWALGWLVTANVIVDADRGYVTFGASGALLATALTGLSLRAIVGAQSGLRAALMPRTTKRDAAA